MNMFSHCQNQIEQIQPGRIEKFLSYKNWYCDYKIENKLSIWHIENDNLSEILLPLNNELKDYKRALKQVFVNISEFYNYTINQAIENVIHFDYDKIQVRVDKSDIHDGTIPFKDGLSIIEGTKEMLASASYCMEKRKRFVASLNSSHITDMINNVRLGQTEVGSYIINLFSPAFKEKKYLENTLEEDEFSVEIEETYYRSVLKFLGSSLDSLKQSTDSFKKYKNLSIFAQNVPQGVSYNLCDSITKLAGVEKRKNVEIQLMFASQIQEDSQKIEFHQNDIEIIQQAAEYLREEELANPCKVNGPVIQLRRDPKTDQKTIKIEAHLNTGLRKVNAELTDAQYEEALRAHENQQNLTCEGSLKIEPRNSYFEHVEKVYIEEDTTDTNDLF